MVRELIMLPLRLASQAFEIALVTFLAAVTRITNQVTEALRAWAARCKSTVFAVATVLIMFFILLWLAIFIYWSFYFSYVPAMAHTRDVNFVFSSCDMRGPCSYPAANMSLSPKGQNLLMRGQQYSFSLELDMPESPSNRELGMFMVRMDLYTKHGEVVRSAQRAAMITYKSTLYRIIETIFFIPLLLYNFSQQKQLIDVQLFNNYIEDPYKPVLGAFVEIQSRFIELYKANLLIEAHFTGIRYILYAWPLTSALVGVSMITLLLCLIALLSWYNLLWNAQQNPENQGRSMLTGSVPRDLIQPEPSLTPIPETVGVRPSSTTSDFEKIEETDTEEKLDGAFDLTKEVKEVSDLEELGEDPLTLRKRVVGTDDDYNS